MGSSHPKAALLLRHSRINIISRLFPSNNGTASRHINAALHTLRPGHDWGYFPIKLAFHGDETDIWLGTVTAELKHAMYASQQDN